MTVGKPGLERPRDFQDGVPGSLHPLVLEEGAGRGPPGSQLTGPRTPAGHQGAGDCGQATLLAGPGDTPTSGSTSNAYSVPSHCCVVLTPDLRRRWHHPGLRSPSLALSSQTRAATGSVTWGITEPF